jgi:hypothetical protein
MRRVALLPGLALACTLHGDGTLGEQTRSLPVFDVVEVFDNFAVTLAVDTTMAATDSIEVKFGGDANALGRLFGAVHEVDTLSLKIDPNHLTELSLEPTMSARVPALRRVYAEDSAVVEVSGARDSLAIELHEAATMTVQADEAVAVDVIAGGDAALDLAGFGPSLNIVSSGKVTIDARAFAAEAVRVEHRGTGEILVCATRTILIYGRGATKVHQDCP